jgi:hypothetical protein
VAKANIVLAGGTKVTIEGNAAEVATLLQKFSQPGGGSEVSTRNRKRIKSKSVSKKAQRKTRKGPTSLILALRDQGFFKGRKTLSDLQRKLEEQGHIYAQTSLSPILVRLVRSKELRRLKEKKGWVYVN